jgi:glc operon protein GlcG
MSRRIALGLALVSAASLAVAQDRRPDNGPPINIAAAKKIAAGVLAECAKNSWNVAVAIVEPSGSLVYFERMENTQYAGIDIAIGKARTAATLRRPTRALFEVANKMPAYATLPALYALPGGLPIMADGKVIGGVGVSGVTGDQDEQCAKVGLGS